jgi:hypothetical protein
VATKEEILHEVTFKGHELEVSQRIFLTLTSAEGARTKRTAKAVALLLALLHKKRFLSDQQLDDFLYDCIT